MKKGQLTCVWCLENDNVITELLPNTINRQNVIIEDIWDVLKYDNAQYTIIEKKGQENIINKSISLDDEIS